MINWLGRQPWIVKHGRGLYGLKGDERIAGARTLEQQAIIDLMKDHGGKMTVREVATFLGETENSVRGRMRNMALERDGVPGILQHIGHQTYLLSTGEPEEILPSAAELYMPEGPDISSYFRRPGDKTVEQVA